MLRRVFQFKIAMKEIEPMIWRRIVVPETYSFWDLHVAIQDSMGWLDYHLHAFRIHGADDEIGIELEIGIPPDGYFEGEREVEPGWEIPIREYFGELGDEMEYVYDFGDGWKHRVILEGILLREKGARYPKCIAGERACPPEDCGGVHGYEELLKIIADPDHEEYKSMMTWLGGRFLPSAFNPKKVKFDNPRKRWKIAFEEA